MPLSVGVFVYLYVGGVIVQYTEPEEQSKSFPSNNKEASENSRTEDEDGDDEKSIGTQVALPEIRTVRKENWDEEIDSEEFDPQIAEDFDESTLVNIDASRDETISTVIVTVNMDSSALRKFIYENNVKDRWKKPVENRYLRAIVFDTVAHFHRYKRREEEGNIDEEWGHAEYIEQAINDRAPVIMLSLYGEEELERITE